MKTPEQMAEEHAKLRCPEQGPEFIVWCMCRDDFLAGYQAAKDQWISVKERLPEINQEVLISYGKKPFLLVAFLYHPQYPKKDVKVFCGTNNTNYSLEYVTHWMPLPEPPRKTK